MKKLIEKQQNSLVTCDNPKCDYTYPYNDHTQNMLFAFINMPCPKCGENLLTQEDYQQHVNLIQIVDFINKWFSWITLFMSKNPKQNKVKVHVHNGVKFTNIDTK